MITKIESSILTWTAGQVGKKLMKMTRPRILENRYIDTNLDYYALVSIYLYLIFKLGNMKRWMWCWLKQVPHLPWLVQSLMLKAVVQLSQKKWLWALFFRLSVNILFLPLLCLGIVPTFCTAATELYLYARVDPKATNFTAGNRIHTL